MTKELDRSLYPGVPEDFPIEWEPGAVSGAQPKLLLVKEGEKFYHSGTAPSQVQEALEICLDLQQQLTDHCIKKAALGQEPNALLINVYKFLVQKDWCQPAQSRWICVQIAKQLGWGLPVELQVKDASDAPAPGGVQ